MGSIDVRYDNKNPAELYPSTTWELISQDKYIKSGSIALQTGGSNSISISKANLPNVKLKVDSFSVTTQPHTHDVNDISFNNHAYSGGGGGRFGSGGKITTTSNGGGTTGTASPYTENLGNGTALSIQPTYITLKFWKRLT